MNNKDRVLFFGTPSFAKASLEALVESGENVVGVVTQPDKKRGRGMKLCMSEVKEYALSKDIDVYQPNTLKDEETFLPILKKTNPAVIVVAAYGKILPCYILEYPKYGCLNVHGSLLPKYRGAAPIQRAIMEGEKTTGITIMQMDCGLDTGDILLTEELHIGENETAGELFERLSLLGGSTIVKALKLLREGKITAVKQSDECSFYACKICGEDTAINFEQPSAQVHNQIRGLTPCPGACTSLSGKQIKLCGSLVNSNEGQSATPGEIIGIENDALIIQCKPGTIKVCSCKPEGRAFMSAKDLINGRTLKIGDIFGK